MPKRIQLSRKAGWRKPAGVLSVSRPTIWGNPWVGPNAVLAYAHFCEQVRGGVLCISVIEEALLVERKFEKPLDEWKTLRGLMFEFASNPTDIACWCPLGSACHGDVILALPSYFRWYRAAHGTGVANER